MRRGAALATLLAVAAGAAAQPAGGPLVALHDVDPDAAGEPARAAFRAVFGRAAPARRTHEGVLFDFEPVTSVDLGGGRLALVITGVAVDAGHSATGVNAVHYLARSNGRLRVAGRWFGLGADGSHGRAANRWGVTRALSRWPVLYTEGGGTWQGCTVAFATLTELRPTGPVDVAAIPIHFSNRGMVGDEAVEVDGMIERAVSGRTFTVRYAGTMRFRETYIRVGDNYRLAGGRESRVPGC